MNFSSKLVSIIESKEKKDNRYEYGCAMVYFDFPEMPKLHAEIKEDEIYAPKGGGYGLETEPHVTLLFGLHDEEIEDSSVLDACLLRKYKNMKLDNVSLFKNDEFEVLKFDVECEDLHYVNNILSKLPHTTRYPDYHPHTTIAYLKPGKGDDVIERLNIKKAYKVKPEEIVYSKSDKSKVKRKI